MASDFEHHLNASRKVWVDSSSRMPKGGMASHHARTTLGHRKRTCFIISSADPQLKQMVRILTPLALGSALVGSRLQATFEMNNLILG